MSLSILIIEQNPEERRQLASWIEESGYRARAVADVSEAAALLARPMKKAGDEPAPADAIALVLLGWHGDVANKAVLSGGLPVIALLDHGGSEAAQALAAGAQDILIRPVHPGQLRRTLRNALWLRRAQGAHEGGLGVEASSVRFTDIIGTSEGMRRAIEQAGRAAGLSVPVLLEGEPGTGKMLMARAIHNESGRTGPFTALDCASTPEQDILRVLEGERDASQRSGTLYLAEIGALSAPAQARLYTMLENRTAIQAEEGPAPPRLRILCGTSEDLIARVKLGALREDLYYRLNIFPIRIPPLRERGGDIVILAAHFAAIYAARSGKRLDGLAPEVFDLLSRYSWPGNVRQLENAVAQAVALAEGPTLTLADFPQITALAEAVRQGAARSDLMRSRALAGDAARAAKQGPAAVSRGGAAVVGIPALTEGGEVRTLVDIEADAIRLALGRYRGRMTEVARRLGIGRSTLYRKMRELGLDPRPGMRA